MSGPGVNPAYLYPRGSFAVTLHDTNVQNANAGVYIGGAGTLVAQLDDDTTDSTFIGLQAGQYLPFNFRLLKSTGSTVTNLVGLRMKGD